MSRNTDLAKMSIKAGVEGEGKPMKVVETKPIMKGRIQPVATTVKPARGTPNKGESIF